MEQCAQRRLPTPKAIENAPLLFLGLEIFYRAFLELSSSRTAQYETEGPIPWTVVRKWAKVHKLKKEQKEDLFFFISQLDEEYLNFKTKRLLQLQKEKSK